MTFLDLESARLISLKSKTTCWPRLQAIVPRKVLSISTRSVSEGSTSRVESLMDLSDFHFNASEHPEVIPGLYLSYSCRLQSFDYVVLHFAL
jgi:hypothetical protein